jgi:pimeloyl-ACP methyl ester carboxylesterase
MPALETGDRTVSYEAWGAGPVAVLVHGSPGNGRSWARVAERLADRYRVIAPDLPGYGSTTPAPGASSVGYGAGTIEALIADAGDPVVLAAHSYGGVVALAVALRGRVRVGALVLFEPVAVPMLALTGDYDTLTHARTVFTSYIASVEAGHTAAIRTMVDFWFGTGVFERMPAGLTAGLIQAAPANVRDVAATFRETYTADALARLTMPVITVVGDRSPDVTHRIAKAIARHVPHGSIAPLTGATHAMTTTHVDAVAELIANAARTR